MSCIHLHLGQAGIQLGESFWGLAEEEFFVDGGEGGRGGGSGKGGGVFRGGPRASESSVRLRSGGTAMFHQDGGWARCLAVDSEPKVVQRFQGRVGSLRAENAIYSQSGLANNWAMGFASCRSDREEDGAGGGPFSRCMEAVRREAERSCWLNSVVMTHSLAGGTGSGLGSGLLQARRDAASLFALRDDYPSLYLISACVGPFGTGDTPLQHYNSVLALQHLQAYADCVVFRGNDDLLRGATEASVRKNATPAPNSASTVASVGRDGGRGWRPVGLFSTGRGGSSSSSSSSFGAGAAAAAASGRRRGAPGVSTADMNSSLALDMASYFFPTSRSFERSDPDARPASGRRHRARQPRHQGQPQQQQQQRQWQQESAPRQFDGGSLMAAACPLPAAKFVDLRSTLSVGPTAANSDGGGGGSARDRSLASSSSRPSAVATKNDWAALVNHLGRRAPLYPRRAGGLEDDVCVAAHHVVRGATFGERATATGAGSTKAGVGVARAGAGGAGEGVSATNLGSRRGYGGGEVGGTEWPGAAAGTEREVSGQASEGLRRHHECPEWRTATDVSFSPALRSRGISRSVATVCNQTRIRGVLGGVVARAEEKFRARAYLHWYYRHGLEDDDFLAAFEGVRTVERGYDGLARALGGGGVVAGTG
ncbi:unnamed protein product [Hapterophycus canaliculatus]